MFCWLGFLHFKWHKSYSEGHTRMLEGLMDSKVEHLESESWGVHHFGSFSYFLYWSLTGFILQWGMMAFSHFRLAAQSLQRLVKSTSIPVCIAVSEKNCNGLCLGHTCPPSCCLGDRAVWLTAHHNHRAYREAQTIYVHDIWPAWVCSLIPS